MEDIPPSYDDINVNVLDLLPPYLSTATLVNLCLVSKTYYATFIPHLWGSPASHFVQVANETARTTNGLNFANLQVTGSHNDLVYVALTRFKRILRRARVSTRMLCHTLHLPPALSEIYGGPNSTWLREVLDWLPGLQSLCVSGLPFFDHDSLVAVDQSRKSVVPPGLNDEDFRQYPVKLLLAAKEPNVTWVGLSLLLPHLPGLVYLDLSYTSPARNINVLRSLAALTHLQVLKLRGVGLRDNELEVLANVLGLRVRLLDIADNQLSDMAVRSLLQACVRLPSTISTNGSMPNDQYSRRHLESWPVGLPPPPDSLSLDTIRTVELDEALLNQLTNPLTGRLAFEDIPHGGITHLFISGNPGVTIESIRGILDLGRLHVLDAGDIAALTPVDLHVLAARQRSGGPRETLRAKSTHSKNIKGVLNRHRSRPSSMHGSEAGASLQDPDNMDDDLLKMPGAEKLIPVLQDKASKNLTHLRIDHAVVTAAIDPVHELKEKDKAVEHRAELPGELSRAAELDAVNREVFEVAGSRSHATEMSSETATFEMDATLSTPRVELPGDIIHFALSPPVGDAPETDIGEVISPVRGEGAMAPEVVDEPDTARKVEDGSEEVVLNATGSGLQRRTTSATNSTMSTMQSDSSQRLQSEETVVERPAPLTIRKKPDTQLTDAETVRRRSQSMSVLYTEMDKLTKLRPKRPATKLHPSFLPHLRTLVLTNLPSQVPASEPTVIESLQAYIAACAVEERLAALRAHTNYSLPPGRARQNAERQHKQTLFALQTIVLEINPVVDAGNQRGWKHTRQRLNISKSSTGDADSEALWSAADNDFSFFGEEGEESAECGVYDQEPDKYYPTTIPFDDKIVVTHSDEPGASNNHYVPHSPRIVSPQITHFGSPGGRQDQSNPLGRNDTVFRSPRNLPLGRNRRISNDMHQGAHSPTAPETRFPLRSTLGTPHFEMPGTIPPQRPLPPASNPGSNVAVRPSQATMLDVVAELAKWRRERKAVYDAEMQKHRQHRLSSPQSAASGKLVETKIYVEGHWPGEIKVIRNPAKTASKGKMERQGNVDIYGNYFEGGYLYP
ncbi:hypothetical protein LTS08_001615 [Lithohypha guttulata]|nr:hypothetical protein LTS08_001615 [Lithohypha guttulata]